jgi:TPR repeat protein
MFNLAVCYERGNGIEKDLATAVHWYAHAAKLGHDKSMFKLAVCNEHGEGIIAKDLSTTCSWVRGARKHSGAGALSRFTVSDEAASAATAALENEGAYNIDIYEPD